VVESGRGYQSIVLGAAMLLKKGSPCPMLPALDCQRLPDAPCRNATCG
jgi:hypothetical protein